MCVCDTRCPWTRLIVTCSARPRTTCSPPGRDGTRRRRHITWRGCQPGRAEPHHHKQRSAPTHRTAPRRTHTPRVSACRACVTGLCLSPEAASAGGDVTRTVGTRYHSRVQLAASPGDAGRIQMSTGSVSPMATRAGAASCATHNQRSKTRTRRVRRSSCEGTPHSCEGTPRSCEGTPYWCEGTPRSCEGTPRTSRPA